MEETGYVCEKAQNKQCDILTELKSRLFEANMKLDILLDNIPGGVLSYDVETSKFDFISKGCLSIFHCKEEEFREYFYNSFDLFVMKADRSTVKEMITDQLRFFDSVELTYRVKDLQDNEMWIYHKGRLVKDNNGREMFYIVISDVTEEKLVHSQIQKINEQLYIETERYKLIEEAVDNIQYDYDVLGDLLTCSVKDSFGNRKVIPEYSKNRIMERTLHTQDYPTCKALFEQALREPTKGVAEYRSRFMQEDYIWYRINYASFSDKSDKVIRVVGSAKDITKEKLKQEEMRAQIDLDGMTGLLNKVAIRTLIEEYLKECDIGICHAMMVIDTDNFKLINDTFGHMYGDKVIKFVADTIRETFRESDFVGRIGGDEFLVFMKHTTPLITEDRATTLNKAIARVFTQNDISIPISCSIGIAYYGKDGEDYNEIFLKADAALYEAKEQGKNSYVVSHR